MKIQINLTNNQNNFDVDESSFIKKCDRIMQQIVEPEILEKSPLAKELDDEFFDKELNIDIVLCDNEQIHQLNKEYRDKDRPTDVITFALFADAEQRVIFGDEIHLGEIIISTDQISLQAQQNNKAFDEELYFILAHGILHLLGFVHDDEQDLEFMIKIQEQLIV